MAKKLMKGNEAIGEAAIQAGCRHYFAYPITPQTEVAEYLARRMPEVGGVFLQAESEVAAANMLFGASSSGVRVFTSSSSPGISLMSEATSYIAGAQLPVVLINIVRGGPGLGGILPAQSDYFQATKGGGHGDYHLLVLAPSTVQEAVDHVILAFELADKYRNPAMVIGDGMIGQMMEPVEFPSGPAPVPPPKPWATTGARGRGQNLIRSLFLNPDELERNNLEIKAKCDQMMREEVRFEAYRAEDELEVLVVAYGTMARIAKTAIDALRSEGRRVGLLRPITLYPFPMTQLHEAATRARAVLVVELSTGQMVEDVRWAVEGKAPVHFFGKTGGNIPTPEDITQEIRKVM
ncbi:MAG: 3-methyl-2-oxobutanoate dehydrogenase subunit VorB [Polyangia bacterium]|jgi:2-oxoglutarate ferredoxin oxidoreductase subunit alpha|nr:3-methyl-2-oxobutanoate dehydrogenase subunit VorB [Polyangia bacterium]